jgi:hypothetical protein
MIFSAGNFGTACALLPLKLVACDAPAVTSVMMKITLNKKSFINSFLGSVS